MTDTRRHPLIFAEGLVRTTNDGAHTIVEARSLAIFPGECVVLAGPSGSGKSLLLRALIRLDPLSNGRVYLEGMPVADTELQFFRSQVSLVPQRPLVLEGTVEDNLRAPFELALYKGRYFERERAVTALKQVGWDEAFLAQQASDLSGGEAQIVALLRALLLEPQVLLLDEPTAALDPQTTLKVEQLLREWVSGDRGILWVSHDPEQQKRVASRIVCIIRGELAEGDDCE